MMAENAKMPAIRFVGFTQAWERHMLGDETFEIVAGGDVDKEILVDRGRYPVIANALTNDGIIGYYDNEYRIKAPAVTVTGRGDVGHAKARYSNFTPIVRLLSIKSRHDIDFLENGINTLKIVVESTGVPQLTVPQLAKYALYFPKTVKAEQVIGLFFRSLDNLITLRQRKYDKLVTIKKAMLEKMFPKNGSSFPEIRFSGFTEAWEQRKVGDCCEMFNGDRSPKYPNDNDMVDVGIPFINAGDLDNGAVNLLTCNKITRSKYNQLGGAKLKLGDIVYCLRGTLGKNAFIDGFDEGTVASSLVVIRPKNIDGRYLFYILNSDTEYRQRIVHDEGAAQPNLSARSVSEFDMPVPIFEEQQKISTYFTTLDNLITLHRRKLEKLRNLKKAFLEKMFV